MNTVQTNVRVPPGDKPLLRAIAARLRIEPRFRDRLTALIEEDPAPALQQRIARLEEQVDYLLGTARGPGHAAPRAAIEAHPLNGGSAD
jgi:hypothetical protein